MRFGRHIAGAALASWFVCLLLVAVCFGQGGRAYLPGGLAFNTVVFNCTGFQATGSATVGTCGVGGQTGLSGTGFSLDGTTGGSSPGISGSAVTLIPASCDHCALSLTYQPSVVNVQKFKTSFTFVANGWNAAFVVNNSNNNPSFNGKHFSAGAGCEGAFFQGFAQTSPPNNVFAVMFDSYSNIAAGASASSGITYTSVGYYQAGLPPPNAPSLPGQSPCNPDLGTSMSPSVYTYTGTNKVSTYPVPLNTPCSVGSCASFYTNGTVNVGTGDTYAATITYDGVNLTVTLYDVTAGGTCTPVTSATCFTTTWNGVAIPYAVGNSNTAWAGILASTASSTISTIPMNVGAWEYQTP